MNLRVVVVTGPATLRYRDLAVAIQKGGEEVGRVPIEDMAVLLLDGPDLHVSHQLLAACAEANVAVVVSDPKHRPAGLLLPLAGHSLHSATLRDQIDASLPAQKRAWQSIVRAKLLAQADALDHLGRRSEPIRKLVGRVRSGDPDNVEAQAATRYFDALFGDDFIRDRDAPGVNAMLNYGYAVIRSCVARAVVGAGLHPSLGIHHHNQYNPFCLADDAMEPYRPLVDVCVAKLAAAGEVEDELTPTLKRRLVTVAGGRVRIGSLRYPFLIGLERFAAALRRAICEGEPLDPPLPAFDDP